MEISNVNKVASSIAETGSGAKPEVAMAVLKKAMQIDGTTATALIDAVQAPEPARLPSNLGNKVNTTA